MKRFPLILLSTIFLFTSCSGKKKPVEIEPSRLEIVASERPATIPCVKPKTKNRDMNNIIAKNNIRSIDPRYISKYLFAGEQAEILEFDYYLVEGRKAFNIDGYNCHGITFYYPECTVFVSDNNESWCGTPLTQTEKCLIHEMAHVLADAEAGSRKHEDDWVSEVQMILRLIQVTTEEEKLLLNDIINPYGYKR